MGVARPVREQHHSGRYGDGQSEQTEQAHQRGFGWPVFQCSYGRRSTNAQPEHAEENALQQRGTGAPDETPTDRNES